MGDEVLNQSEAWAVYDRWLNDDRVGATTNHPISSCDSAH